jgi:peptide/nickel transport system substrate-binding protein
VRRRVLTTAAALSAAAVTVAACSSSGSSASPGTSGSANGSSTGAQQYANGRAATVLLPSDPGSLDPDLTSLSATYQADMFLYDSLIDLTSAGKVESGLASSWSGSMTSATFTLKKGVTCSDGSPLTARS